MASDGEFTVMVAVDKSKLAEEAFDWYLNTCHLASHKVYLVTVHEGPTSAEALASNAELSLEDWQYVKATEQQETRLLLSKYERKVKEYKGKLNIDAEAVTGDPGEALVKASKDVKANLVIMGTRGQGVIRRTILGSVSDYVMHHASVPVVICRI